MTETPQQGNDAARRCADHINTHVLVNGEDATGKWVAVKLSDGDSDGILYPTKKDAVRHQLHEMQCAYICIPPACHMSTDDAASFLQTNRKLYDAGMRLSDPDTHIQTPMRKEFR